jgi:methyl-accepting chemotaxis protein
MDQMTQQNAALVEETNAALHAAQNQVEELRRAVAFFQTGEVYDDTATPAATPQPVPATINPVREQFEALTRKMAVGANTIPVPLQTTAFGDWKEF